MIRIPIIWDKPMNPAILQASLSRGIILVLLFPVLFLQSLVQAEVPIRDVIECSPRGGLPHFFSKLQKGEEVTIAYLGGSITAQEGWRVLSHKWFEEQYPDARISGINAAIGGTGSNLGVFRLQNDVLIEKPDLVFVEFAVNDAGAAPDLIVRSMEGIVRQTWKKFPECDICFVYTITENDIKHLQQGNMSRSASAMEAVADHYRIPSIHMGLEIARLEKESKLVMKAEKEGMERVSGDELNVSAGSLANPDGIIPFSKDGVHPYTDTGHQLYMNAIIRSMPCIKAAGQSGLHSLGDPIDPGNFERACLLPIAPSMFSGPAGLMDRTQGLGKQFASRLPGLWKAEPGAVLRFRFKGNMLMIYDLLGPNSGMVEITVDGEKTTVKRMDGYSSYSRLSMLKCASDIDAEKVHAVAITVLDETFDKREILFEKSREDYDKNPEKYAGRTWYPGAILLVGELVD